MSDNYPEILSITLKAPFDKRIPGLLAGLALPKFDLEWTGNPPDAGETPPGAARGPGKRKWWQFWGADDAPN